ncbi:PIN domain-like protein [Hyaloscypha hepaticicola]|uniref:PIN domain-like protein n=1 Tax=Hyaloscypha hepaticicola TaxID=2082293 RepID=A0A2J6QEC8_9HELO|nr:PIN domain-like protein [Hyaloscypha hepaticicola]
MGVTGLWPILAPSARPTPLPTLNRKRLAVDASIWIYQFLKAVRDKEGNALRNSHVVGFFRRICKLLYFGIKPVFVFDGGAPALKRQTILGRKKRREGRREDAVRTAGKLLAVQMKRRGEEEEEKRKKERERERLGLRNDVDEEEPLPRQEDMVYVGELGMSSAERQRNRTFRKTDQYHLPELENGIEGMGQPNDPRIMSAEELEEYARQFHNGEDVNLYDFSKIDFNGEFFLSLPAGDRYNILNAARLRSRLRMGLSKEQLEEMFPDRMAFSRFQIERVRERNELTQRLMNLNGMNGEDGLFGVGGGRIAGERGREYVLVKNDGVEGGWALGVVSTEKVVGERERPIDVDALHQEVKKDEEDDEEDEDFEDVPVEGLNRLPKAKPNPDQNLSYNDFQAWEMARQRSQIYASRKGESSKSARIPSEEPASLFVDDNTGTSASNGLVLDEEEEELNRAIALSLQQDDAGESNDEEHLRQAIALSLQKNHHVSEPEDEEDFEDVPMPQFEQRPVEAPKPITSSSGGMIAHIVNNRANAAVAKRNPVTIDSDSDSEMDLQSALAKARKQKAPEKRTQPAPVPTNTKNPFDGPLPFEKLDLGTSIFNKKKPAPERLISDVEDGDEEDMAGGFDNALEKEAPRPLPPWMVGKDDIRSQSNVEIVDAPPSRKSPVETLGEVAENSRADPPVSDIQQHRLPSVEAVEAQDEHQEEQEDEEEVDWSESDYGDAVTKSAKAVDASHPAGGRTDAASSRSKSASPEFEDVEMPEANGAAGKQLSAPVSISESPLFEEANMPDPTATFPSEPPSASKPSRLPIEESFERQLDAEFGDFSDPEDEELLAQLAIEAEEHARFASTLNNKSERENQESYERELKALRNQQKKDRRDADEVSHIMVTECQALLRLFGLPYITAPMEAEAQCAELVRLGLVDGVVTDDCDIFLFGGTRVYKNMFNSNKMVECYLADLIEKELSLSRDQLIAIAHLLGSDYTEGLPGERTDEVLVPVIRDMNRREQEGTQSNITRYFDGAVGAGAVGGGVIGNPKEKVVGSKRMKDAVSKLRAKKTQPLGGESRTFADHAVEWAKKNDLTWTEREQEKHLKKSGKGRGKRKARAASAIEEADHVTGDVNTELDADDADESEEEYREPRKIKGKGMAKRKRTKV